MKLHPLILVAVTLCGVLSSLVPTPGVNAQTNSKQPATPGEMAATDKASSVPATKTEPAIAPQGPPFQATVMLDGKELGNKPERLTWLQDNGFGMFIHFSFDSQSGSVISHSVVGASDDYVRWFYEELPKTFNPREFDADAIARLAKVCGMKYVVLTTKHHSGFCLWDSDTTDLKITNTPYGKDLVQEYVDAIRKQGLAVGFYFSPEDFHWAREHGYPIQRRNLPYDPDQLPEFVDFNRAQMTELFTRYGDIDMLFIDGEGQTVVKQVAWSTQPNCLITRGAIPTPEQFVPGRAPEGAWESNITMGTQWSYKPTNDDYKSGSRIIELLIETRCKGGSLMMNIGPKATGAIPFQQEDRLREVALWRAVNGEAVYDIRPWVVTNEDDIWFSRNKDSSENRNTVFAYLTRIRDWKHGDRKEFLLQSVRATPETKISVLGHTDTVVEYHPEIDPTSRFEQTDDGLRISVVRAQRLYNNYKWPNPVVVKIENVVPAFEAPPYAATLEPAGIGADTVTLKGNLSALGDTDEVEVWFEYQTFRGFAEAMYNTQWTATEKKTMRQPGDFEMQVTDLVPGTDYQIRAVVRHPRITLRGDHLRMTTLKSSATNP